MINKFSIILITSFTILGCKMFNKSSVKKTANKQPKYSFAVVDSSVFFNCGQLRYNPGHWFNEYFDGICRNDSIVIIYHRNGKSILDTIATYDPCVK